MHDVLEVVHIKADDKVMEVLASSNLLLRSSDILQPPQHTHEGVESPSHLNCTAHKTPYLIHPVSESRTTIKNLLPQLQTIFQSKLAYYDKFSILKAANMKLTGL